VTQIGLLGASGRMGQWVQRLIVNEYAPKATLAAQARAGDSLQPLLQTDVIIDFSGPEAVLDLIETSKSSKKRLPPLVVGSTGWKPEQRKRLDQAAKKSAILISSNFSTGVLALQEILKTAGPLLKKLGYSPVLVETHHRHKKDAPSGTALTIQRTLESKNPQTVQTHSVRSGEIIGDHEVSFYGPADHLVVGHFAQDRSIFARGAIDASLWLAERQRKKPMTGIQTMENFFRERFL